MAEVPGRLVALLAILRQAAPHDAGELARETWVDLREGPRRVTDDGREDGDDGIALEWPLADGHLVEHDAEGEQVGPVIERAPVGLLGRHVRGRAHDVALGRQLPEW